MLMIIVVINVDTVDLEDGMEVVVVEEGGGRGGGGSRNI